MLRQLLLAFLSSDQPAHGYGLMKRYRERMGVPVSIGNVYRELQRLVGDGLIATAANPPGADARRAPYGLTTSGREALATWLATPIDGPGRSVDEEVACRLAVVGDMPAVDGGALLVNLHRQLWDLAKRVERDRAISTGDGDGSGRSSLVRQTLLARQAMHLAADIELVNELMASLTKRDAPAERSIASSQIVAERPSRRMRPRGIHKDVRR